MRNVSDILARERNAWGAYRDYVTDKMGPQARQVDGDDRSRALFTT